MKIGLANDHRGYNTKEILKKYLQKKGYEVVDYGSFFEEMVDYPDYAFYLGESVAKKEVDFGIIVCGTGIGVSIACNKVKGIRCAKVDTVRQAKLTRKDNDANVLALDGTMNILRILDIVDTFLKTQYVSVERYDHRIQLIKDYEKNHKRIKTKEEKELEEKTKKEERKTKKQEEKEENHES